LRYCLHDLAILLRARLVFLTFEMLKYSVTQQIWSPFALQENLLSLFASHRHCEEHFMRRGNPKSGHSLLIFPCIVTPPVEARDDVDF
jgi:hypothetical protein